MKGEEEFCVIYIKVVKKIMKWECWGGLCAVHDRAKNWGRGNYLGRRNCYYIWHRNNEM